LDEILKDYQGPGDFYGPEGIMKQLTKALVQRTMEAELTGHLGYGSMTRVRNQWPTAKALRTGSGPMTIEVPRDREGTFEPHLVQASAGV
jgi:transposase-like protein